MKQTDHATPGLLLALTPVVLTLLILGTQIFYFGVFEPHIPLAIGLAITSIVGIKLGLKWKFIEKGIFHVIHVALPSVSVLITVGMIIGVWIASGTVPSIIYFGLKILSPEIFLAAGMVICAVVSVSLGTSWGSVGTVGLALMGIGEGFDIPMYWTAGAVVSGAFFGDKISPLSDTTNLAPAVTGTDVFSHIKNMMATTIPAMLIALIIYLLVGFFVIDTQSVSFEQIEGITSTLDENFYISGWVLLPALVVMGLAIKQYPPIPSLFAGVVVGGATAMLVQGQSLQSIFDYANNGYSISTGIGEIDSLLNRGGIQSMMWTISLILIALGFGGALEKTGCLKSIINAIKSKVSSFAGTQTAAIGTAFATNLVAGDPYLSVALPGRMYSPVYRGMGYSTLNLSRGIEEGGTLMSPLIPWNAGGAFVISALGLGIAEGNIENLLYIPLAFACWTAPLIGIFYAYTGLFSPKATDEEREGWESSGESIAEFNDDGTPKVEDEAEKAEQADLEDEPAKNQT
ncbi:Na+/H+ antiporter NhaC [Brumicola nitratireducens]|uniref:Na+/H+ antiporter, NhaC family protein n=1 Tax=Glaciecola nitratireducens (strain JCM 12485 / KCTC 12276 / FR1064) TaxID=1085623 RepID=G4QEC1_GLANF|nr:Na+/H+ antiporter NhaC [Glaciecola nitratireducens]AEP31396.1 Na+/H+ antiporter, NhaC family protein [Glaciecola nitratireducens FR1064]